MATSLKSVKATAIGPVITASGVSAGVKITGVSFTNGVTAADPAGSETVTVNGSGFNSGAKVFIDTTSYTTTYANSNALTFTSPAKSIGAYNLYVYNTDGSSGILPGGMVYSSLPTWVTSAGALAGGTANLSYSQNVSATGDGTITYSLTSGSLPSGLSLNTSTGAITGTAPSSLGTSTFTITATDSQGQTASRSFNIQITNYYTADYLVVAGGGGGFSGGGGAGGFIEASNASFYAGTTYTITVGAGGVSPVISTSGVAGTNGANSSISGSGFTTVTAFGGGGGGSGTVDARNGGSGGGGGWTGTYGRGVYPGSTYISAARQGYDGAQGSSENLSGGGGGAGAGTSGGGRTGGQGGADYYSSITGTSLPYCGGGAGSGGTSPGPASVGGTGGAAGAPNNIAIVNGSNGTVNRGGGGGGTRGDYSLSAGGSGGSGVVIIRYPNTYNAAANTTGTVSYTTPTGYRVYTFNSSGTITF